PVGEHWHTVQMPGIRAHGRHGEHVSSIKNKLCRVAMIAMIVRGTVQEHKVRSLAVRTEGPDKAHYRFRVGRRNIDLAIRDAHAPILCPDHPNRGRNLANPWSGEKIRVRNVFRSEVPFGAIRYGNDLDRTPASAEQRHSPANVSLNVIRMRPNGQYMHSRYS